MWKDFAFAARMAIKSVKRTAKTKSPLFQRAIMRVLAGKKALVTGAASGIGRAIALRLAREGSELYLLDVNEVGLAAVVDEARAYGAIAIGRHCDLAEPREITSALQSLLDCWGRLDLLVNNAGMAYYGATESMTADQLDRVLAVNLHAPLHLTRQLLPTLLAEPESHVLNVCSIAGLVPFQKLAAYQVTKFGLVGFSHALRAEYFGRGLGVTALCPGFVRTNIYRAALRSPGAKPLPELPAWMCATPERVAAKAIRAVQRDKGVVTVTVAPLATASWLCQRFMPRAMEIVARGRLRRRKRVEPAAASCLQATS